MTETGRSVSERRAGTWAVLLTVVAMTFMSTLDSSIVNIALPIMQDELYATATQIQWISTVYLLVCCAIVLVFGRLGDVLGKARLFQAGVALFTLGSLLCGLSADLMLLIAARAVQGLGAAAATATNMGIVTEVFPASQRGRALGIVATFVSLGLMCGPTIGGVLVAVFPWEWIFLINVPIGLVSFLAGLRTLPLGSAPGEREPFDLRGAVVVVPMVLSLYCSLTFMATGPTPELAALLYGRMGALAGRPVASFADGGAELFQQGFLFAFAVFAALVLLGAVATLLAARLSRRARRVRVGV